MSKTVVIGDCHLTNAYPSLNYLDMQLACIEKILDDEFTNPEDTVGNKLVFLGDLFHFRKPDPETVVKVKKFFDRMVYKFNNYYAFELAVEFFLMRGNHDTASKTDSGDIITILDILNIDGVQVIKDYREYPLLYSKNAINLFFIPHFESDELILENLRKVETTAPDGNNIVFGHFGYAGCFNTNGDQDFSLNANSFKYKTFLGHIHKPIDHGNVFVVGTPYSTAFNESDNPHRYAVIDNSTGEHKFVPINHGPRYLQFDYGSLEANKEFISDPNYVTILRVYLNHITDQNSVDLRKKIMSEYRVGYVDIKYLPLLDEKSDMSSFRPKSMMFELDDEFINNYVDSNNSDIPKDKLLSGLNLLKGSE